MRKELQAKKKSEERAITEKATIKEEKARKRKRNRDKEQALEAVRTQCELEKELLFQQETGQAVDTALLTQIEAHSNKVC